MPDHPPGTPAPSRAGLMVGLGFVAFSVVLMTILMLREPTPQQLARADAKVIIDQGRQIYYANCVACHDERLRGKPTWDKKVQSQKMAGTPLNADGLLWQRTDAQIFAAIADGAIDVNGARRQIHDKGYRPPLTDDDVQALITFIKSTWTAPQEENQPK